MELGPVRPKPVSPVPDCFFQEWRDSRPPPVTKAPLSSHKPQICSRAILMSHRRAPGQELPDLGWAGKGVKSLGPGRKVLQYQYSRLHARSPLGFTGILPRYFFLLKEFSCPENLATSRIREELRQTQLLIPYNSSTLTLTRTFWAEAMQVHTLSRTHTHARTVTDTHEKRARPGNRNCAPAPG